MKRYALVLLRATTLDVVKRYLPDNYTVRGEIEYEGDERLNAGTYALIEGRDVAGWTLDDYVLPRLASGLIYGREIDLSHRVMKQIPDA